MATLPGLVKKAFGGMEGLPQGRAKRRMAKAIATLSTQLRQQTRNEPGLEGLGSTVLCALVRNNHVLLAHMGDSRAYRLRADHLKQLTQDHTLIRLLIESGDITPDQAATHPARGRLTRSVGMEGSPLPQTRLLKLMPGDLFLLCTDGLTAMLNELEIKSTLNNKASLEIRCRKLVDAANAAGGKDNITALLLSFSDNEGKQTAELRELEVSNPQLTSVERFKL